MAFDQNITYRVNVDDSNFQAKLTQMRASMDSSLGGLGGMGMGGFSANMGYGMMGMMAGNQGGAGMGFSDWGTQIRPVSYTPPAIASTPHFGMYQINQTLAQAGLAGMGGPLGVGLSGMMTNFRRGGFTGMLTGPSGVPENITMAEYMGTSARAFGDRAGDIAAIAGVTAASTAGGIALGGAGAAIGAGMFTSGIMRGVGGLMGGMLGGMAVSAYAGQVTDMMAENRATQSALASGSFRFYTGNETDPLTGRGFNRRTRANIATSIQDMELRDVRYGAEDYRQVLEGGMSLDLFSGARDAEEFKTKFKGLVENLKTVTSTMHTSLKEGMEVIRGFRDIGVTDPGEVNRLTMASEMRGRTSGRTGMEMMAIGQAGADIFRGTGIAMERGFELNQMNVGMIRNSLNAGTLSREMIAQAGGENALAQQMTGSALAAFQSAHGRAAMMANFNPATGTMNPNLINNLAGGDLMSQIAGASRMGPAAMLRFQANQEDLISGMTPQAMQMMGLGLDIGMARELQRAAPGLGMEDALQNAMMRRGLGKPERAAELAMLHQNPEQMKQQQQSALENMRVQAGLEDMRNRYGMKAVTNWARRTFVQPVAQAAMNVSTAVGETTDDLFLKVTGQAMVGSGMLSRDLIEQGDKLIQSGQAEKGGAVDVSGGAGLFGLYGQSGAGLGAEISARGTFNKEAGTFSYKGATIRTFADVAAARSAGESEHVGFITTPDKASGRVIALTQENIKEMTAATRELQSTASEVEAAGKATLSDNNVKNLIGIGPKASLYQAFFAIHGGKVDLSDFSGAHKLDEKAFSKKYGMTKGYAAAITSRHFEEYGGYTPEAAKEWETLLSTEGLSDASAAGRARKAEEGAAAYRDLQRMAGGFDIMLSKGQEEIGAVIFGSGDRETKLKRLKDLGVAPAQAMKMVESVAGGKGTALYQRASEDAQKVAASAAMANAMGQAATGAAGVVGSKTMGDLSKETVKVLETQSTQLLENYKQLIALQEKLNSISKGGK